MLTVLRRHNREFWTSEVRMQTGRSALYRLLSLYKFSRVILPSYSPAGLLQPCTQARVETVFYRLHFDLTPDLESLASHLVKDALVIVINYFGYPTPLHPISPRVKEAKAFLLEDCAHCLYGEATKAKGADFGLWSLNKFLPVCDGAILRSRRKEVDLFRGPMLLAGYPIVGRRWYETHLELNARIAEENAIIFEPESEAAYEMYYDTITDMASFEQSVYSKLIESQFDFANEEKVRATNAWSLSMSVPGLRKVGSNSLPQFAYPVLVPPNKNREDVKRDLIKLGVLPSILGDKWIVADPKYSVEMDFAQRHLLLPLGDPIKPLLVSEIAKVVS